MFRYVKRRADRHWFPKPEDMPEALHRLLIERGIRSAEEAEAYLRADERCLHDPLQLSDMMPAVNRIKAALEAGETLCVYGDYDVDGVCASAILSQWLRSKGADARVYLPSRHHEGYGLNEEAIREIAGWAKLMVTVDCGVTSVALVDLAKSLGLDVIVTDHHRPAETLPDCPVINPLLNGYPFPALCGAGVAWKLVCALGGQRAAMEYIDIAALATVADVVSLTGENRAIVRMGLERINARPRLGIETLIESAGLTGKRITSTTIAFQLAPRLNAGGRIGSATRSLALIISEDALEARRLAEELEAENTRRKQIEQHILREAEIQLANFDFAAHRALILAGKDWNVGVIGLAASRLVEKYHYPVILLADQGAQMTGSCRSIEGVDIHAALTACGECLLRFGGHKQAAGLTLLPERLDAFRKAMDDWLFAHIDPNTYIPVREYDMEIRFEEITQGFIASLEDLQPTGFGNPAPVFRAAAGVVEARRVGAEGAHLKLILSQDNHRLNAIAFQAGPQKGRLAGQVDVLFTPKINIYMGRTEVQLEARALADADVFQRIQSKLADETALQCDFLTEMFYNKRINRAAESPRQIDMAEVAGWMAETPQGTLVLATDLSAASRLFRQAGIAQPELYVGELPGDPRAFNAVCVCPPPASIPGGYRRVVLAGMPAEYPGLCGETAFELYALDDRPAWMRLLPDIVQMREAYRAMMRVAGRPVRFHTMEQLAYLVAEEAGLDLRTALASILTMSDLRLISVDTEASPMKLRRNERRRAEPEESEVWRAIQRWRA